MKSELSEDEQSPFKTKRKIWIKNEAEDRKVQEKLFSLNVGWGDGCEKNFQQHCRRYPYGLYVEKAYYDDKSFVKLMYADGREYFNKNKAKELKVEDLMKMRAKVDRRVTYVVGWENYDGDPFEVIKGKDALDERLAELFDDENVNQTTIRVFKVEKEFDITRKVRFELS